MANTHETLGSLFTDIADAIREKNGSTDTITADDFPAQIEAINTSPGDTIVMATGIDGADTFGLGLLNGVGTISSDDGTNAQLDLASGSVEENSDGSFTLVLKDAA